MSARGHRCPAHAQCAEPPGTHGGRGQAHTFGRTHCRECDAPLPLKLGNGFCANDRCYAANASRAREAMRLAIEGGKLHRAAMKRA